MLLRTRRTWWIVAGLVLLVLIVLAIAGRSPDPQVRVATIQRGRLVATISTNGKVEPIRPYELRAQAATFVRRTLVKEGDVVRTGQKLLDLDDNEVRSQLADARNELVNANIALREAEAGGPTADLRQLAWQRAQAKIDLEQAKRNYETLGKLLAKQAASEQEVADAKKTWEKAVEQSDYVEKRWNDLQGRAKTFLESARLRVEQAHNRVQSLEGKLHSIAVVAPIHGTVYGVKVKAGDYVNVGDVLLQMADLRQVQVIAFVDEPELGQLKLGQSVKVTWDAYAGKTWAGQVQRIPAEVVSRGTRSVGQTICRIENPAGAELLPNVNVNVEILVRATDGALLVPRDAVTSEAGKQFVFIVNDHTVRRRAIETGSASFAFFEVLSGLKDSDRVALPGDYRLRDGQRVRVVQ